MKQSEDTTEHTQGATGTGEQAAQPGYSGLAAHLSWALHLDEKQAEEVAEIAATWTPGEGEYAFERCESPAERLAVEIDGHEWHERTKEQAGADRARDISLLGIGIPVIRFTGSQVYADPAECFRTAVRIVRTLEAMWEAVDSVAHEAEYKAFLAGCEKGSESSVPELPEPVTGVEEGLSQ